MEKIEAKYFHDESVHDLRDPNLLVPIFMKMFNPRSVCDVGCGVGNFLYTFKRQGVQTVLGLDGAWVDKNILKKYLEDSEFKLIDFETEVARPSQKFDLALCMEVGEHISGKNAVNLVNYLTQLSDTIIFSAAIPGQGGIGHINLQWEEYWEERFALKGFVRYDIIRAKIFDNKEVRWWYRQNLVVYGKVSLAHHNQSPYKNVVIKDNYVHKLQEIKYYQDIINGSSSYFFYLKLLFKVTIFKVFGHSAVERFKRKTRDNG